MIKAEGDLVMARPVFVSSLLSRQAADSEGVMEMLRFALRSLLPILLVLFLAGCANLRTLGNAQRIDQQIKADRIDFYVKMSDAYRILAYEYYKLASDAESRKQTQLAKEYATRVSLYDAFQKSAKEKADQLRAAWQAENGMAPAQPEPARQAPAAGPVPNIP
jgi:hypothetical protein